MAKLSGKWTLSAIGNEAGFKQRIVISGSNAHDGPHEMTVGDTIAHVEGSAISIVAQAFNPGISIWIDSLILESMNWDNATGLQVTLNVDDNPPIGDLDFNDLVILCTAENAELTSPLTGPRPDLTIPRKFVKPGRYSDRLPKTKRPKPKHTARPTYPK